MNNARKKQTIYTCAAIKGLVWGVVFMNDRMVLLVELRERILEHSRVKDAQLADEIARRWLRA